MMMRPVRPASAGCRAAAQQCPLSGKADTGAFPTEGSFSSPDCAKASTGPCCSCRFLRAQTKQSSRSGGSLVT